MTEATWAANPTVGGTLEGAVPAPPAAEYLRDAGIAEVASPDVIVAGSDQPHFLLICTIGMEGVTRDEVIRLLELCKEEGDRVSGVGVSECPFGARGHIGGGWDPLGKP